MSKILILGGYGNFGKRIATALTKAGLEIIIAGRNQAKAEKLANKLGTNAEIAIFDANECLDEQLQKLKPLLIINTCGPFQTADYRIAESCINKRIHYIDLADGREFVTDISALNEQAINAGVAIISGASTVPGLSSAVIENFKHEFEHIELLKFGISPGQKAERGLATTKGIMTYVGKKLKPFTGNDSAYGWQDIYRQTYPILGTRWMANCDIPDLDLLPKKYAIKKIKFSAGLEIPALHLGLWLLSWGVRLGLPLNLPSQSNALLHASNWLNHFGSENGGMHVILKGVGSNGKPHQRSWFIIAKEGHGPHIPTIPAIHLAKQIASNQVPKSGVYPCVGLISLDNYLGELKDYAITTICDP